MYSIGTYLISSCFTYRNVAIFPYLQSMKHLLIIVFVALFTCKVSAQRIIKAKDAREYIGKTIVIEGKLTNWVNSSYAQFATFDIGTNRNPKQVTVVSQGAHYTDTKAKTWVGKYLGKTVLVKGTMIQLDTIGVWMNMLDTIRLKP
jgi:hypothetical protein